MTNNEVKSTLPIQLYGTDLLTTTLTNIDVSLRQLNTGQDILLTKLFGDTKTENNRGRIPLLEALFPRVDKLEDDQIRFAAWAGLAGSTLGIILGAILTAFFHAIIFHHI